MAKQPSAAFRSALTAAALSRYEALLGADPEPVSFSDEYRKAVARLTKQTERRTWKYVNTAWKRVLIAVILMVLLAATAVAAIPALREGLIRFFTHDNGAAFSFEFTQEDLARAPKEIEQYYAPSYVPYEYELISKEYRPTNEQRLYIDKNGNMLSFTQSVLWQTSDNICTPADVAEHFGVTSENVTVEPVAMQGYDIMLIHIIHSTGAKSLEALWTDHEYFYAIGAWKIEVEEIDQIIGSLTPVEPDQ